VRPGLDDGSRSCTWYRHKGWFESDFYYPTHPGVLKKGAGKLFDSVAASMTKAR
jgi:hypothetical protein